MEAILIYLLKAHVLIILLMAAYDMILKHELMLKLNRVVLFGIILLAICLPLMPAAQISWAKRLAEKTSEINPITKIISEVNQSKEKNRNSIRNSPPAADSFSSRLTLYNFMILFLLVYSIGVMVLLMRFVKQIGSLAMFLSNSTRTSESGMVYYDLQHPSAPFSFFGFIVINRSEYNDQQFRQIFAHEKAHAGQWHSIDMLLTEFAHVLLWCNPFVRTLKSTVRLNLEYLADREVLNKGFDKTDYQRSILQHYLRMQSYSLANTFRSTPTLRIERMMQIEPEITIASRIYNYLYIIPVIAAAWLFINLSATNDAETYTVSGNVLLNKYMGIYEYGQDKGAYIQILQNDGKLVMKTLWNGKEIELNKQPGSDFISKGAGIPLHFHENFDGNVSEFTAFNNDEWKRVVNYQLVKRATEVISIGYGHVWSGKIDPWKKEKAYK